MGDEREDLIETMATMYAEMINARRAYLSSKQQMAARGQEYSALALKMLDWAEYLTVLVTPEMEEAILRRACDELGMDYDTDPDVQPYRAALDKRVALAALSGAAPNN